MSENGQLEPFDRLVRELWEQQGYDVVPVGEREFMATRGGETRLLETYPEGAVTAEDVEAAVSRLIESTETTHVTLVVGGPIPQSLREETEQWDVTLVDETELQGMAESQDLEPVEARASTEPASTAEASPGPTADESAEGSESEDVDEWTTVPVGDETTETEWFDSDSAATDTDDTDVDRAPEGQPAEAAQEPAPWAVARESAALLLEVVLVALLVGTLGYLLVQVSAFI